MSLPSAPSSAGASSTGASAQGGLTQKATPTSVRASSPIDSIAPSSAASLGTSAASAPAATVQAHGLSPSGKIGLGVGIGVGVGAVVLILCAVFLYRRLRKRSKIEPTRPSEGEIPGPMNVHSRRGELHGETASRRSRTWKLYSVPMSRQTGHIRELQG